MSIPDKGSASWKRNEKLINQNPVLKNARDVSEGFRPRGGATHGGKGSATRPGDEQAFKDNYDKIDWNNKDKPSFRVKINGKVVSDPDEPES